MKSFRTLFRFNVFFINLIELRFGEIIAKMLRNHQKNRFIIKFADSLRPKMHSTRIFDRTTFKTMENQHCKVGTVTPMTTGRQAIHLLEFQYQNFMEKASNINDAHLVEYFEGKAQKIKKVLENLV